MTDHLILGGGRLGGTLAARLAETGHDVTVRVRTPDADEYDALRGVATVIGVDAAGPDAELTFVATPWDATEQAIRALGDMAGRTVIDCTNPVSYGPTGMALSIDANTSAAEMIQAWLPDAHLVKAFNQVGSGILGAPSALSPAPLMGVAGDVATAKETVIALVRDLGFDPFDAGVLSNARLLEAQALLWMSQAFSGGDPSGFAFARAQKS
ncbi:NADPH-dependent F420 reductase [Jannaschia sp. CCS1]|uniref:NADPH-dependent F420 reductase n=1 Tax=Jannaschia sp. (strain CCS1) TaxID=290400 RepID=UPI000053DDFE|nr:NAD(P)-binding domain-containing protein [Jannaschia sp. CCS1]ABD56400.1 NADP oxidoreductase coenzyme F420-dependent [Jannaschia sp. CCS1]